MESNVAAANFLEIQSERMQSEKDARPERPDRNAEASSSGVAWGAVIGGAFVAAALYFILLALGAGLGLSAVSPWSNSGASPSAVGDVAIVWLIAIEIIASAMGGYLTGRLRTKWAVIHTDEVYFRDTANGFLAWAVALIISVTFLATGAASMVGSAAVSAPAVTGALNPNPYYVDMLFRSNRPVAQNASDSSDTAAQAEAWPILDNALRHKEVPAADQSYLAGLVAAKTGMTASEADKRVSDVIADARQTEDAARKTTAHLLLWFFLALLMGAFSASYAATIGGRQRDHVKPL
ncbi:MAG TPA: hypothetical protein VGG72_11520 [Bryobacteraceae bacterium]|jgi:hypothetical protein